LANHQIGKSGILIQPPVHHMPVQAPRGGGSTAETNSQSGTRRRWIFSSGD